MSVFEKILPATGLDMHVVWNSSEGQGAGFSSGIDPRHQTIRVMGSGRWNEADAERYFVDQGPIVAEARRRYGQVKVFFDVRAWVVENPQSATQFQEYNRKLYRPEDRLVAVVATSIAKQHPRTALCVGSPECFVSMSAAEMWLQAYAACEGR